MTALQIQLRIHLQTSSVLCLARPAAGFGADKCRAGRIPDGTSGNIVVYIGGSFGLGKYAKCETGPIVDHNTCWWHRFVVRRARGSSVVVQSLTEGHQEKYSGTNSHQSRVYIYAYAYWQSGGLGQTPALWNCFNYIQRTWLTSRKGYVT